MICKVDLKSDPIKLIIIAHNGAESAVLDKIGDSDTMEINLCTLCKEDKK